MSMSSQGQITRDGSCPTFAAYCTNFCVVDPTSDPPVTRESYPDELQRCALRSSGTGGPQDIRIPAWQRKLVWDEENIDDLIHTQSSMYGTVILSKGPAQTDSWILIDGLQRFSVGTAILFSLYDKVLAPSPNNQSEARYFTTIKNQIGNLSPVFIWNHNMLLNHGRTGIKKSYKRMFDEIEKYIIKNLNDDPEQFGKDMSTALLVRQIAVDPYSGFLEPSELLKTFIEINRTGEPLNKLDLLRANLIEQMGKCNFPVTMIDELENQFTEVFQPQKGSAYYTNLGTQLYNIMFVLPDTGQLGTQNTGQMIIGNDPKYVFPRWNNIEKQDFDDLFEYVQNVWDLTKEKQPTDRTKWKWPYMAEISVYKLPFIMLIWFYYKNHYLQFLRVKHDFEEQKKLEIKSKSLQIPLEELQNRIDAGDKLDFEAANNQAKEEIQEIILNHAKLSELKTELTTANDNSETDRIDELDQEIKSILDKERPFPGLFDDLPDFLDGDLDTEDDKVKFYRAMVRKVLDGNIGKTEKILHEIMRGTLTSMDEVSEALNPDNAGTITGPANENWLKGKLMTAKKTGGTPKLVFNACLLPLRGQSTASQVPFKPMIFRNGTGFYNIDHLIPDSKSDENLRGYNELQTLVNLAPLEWEKNNSALATPCSLKLSTSLIYDTIKGIHPYCKWLVDEHYTQHQNDKKVYPISGTSSTQSNEDDSSKRHPFDSQVNLLEGHQNSIAIERISKLVEILTPRL